MKSMTYEDFADEQDYSELFDEMYRKGGLDSDWALDYLERKAKAEHIKLVDEDNFNYSEYFANVYDCTEKGLS